VEQRHVERKLAAILAADVAGYSRLMGVDEEGTLAQFKAHRRALVDPKIKEHRGDIVKTTGDGMLVEFASVVDAVRCAVEVQRGMAERNAGVQQDKRIEFRIGINLGDIVHDEQDIFGDGVNIAARLEGLAEPGGICVSRSVRDPVRDKLGFTFEDMGEQTLKNIASPIHAYRVRFEGADPAARAPPAVRSTRKRNVVAASVVGFAAVCVVAIAVGLWSRRPPPPPAPVQPVAAAQSAPLPLPDKPSIAVLPFTNIGGDAKQERLADGITEDVITDLSRYRELFVIARNSVFAYKGKTVSVQQVGRVLGVRYVLEGSIQISGDRVRVTAQLIEAATNLHVWSARYDRVLDDVFDVQNEVTQKIAAALGGSTGALLVSDAANLRLKPHTNLQAYDYYVLGTELKNRHTNQENFKAEELLKKAIELDPQFAASYSSLASVYSLRAAFWPGHEDPEALRERSKDLELKAIALDPAYVNAHALLGLMYSHLGEFDHSLAAFERAFSLNPNDPSVLVLYGDNLTTIGRAVEGVEMINRAFRLNPQYPEWYNDFSDPFYATGQYDQVITMIRRKRGDLPTWSYMLLAMSYAQLGRQEDSAAALADLLRRFPDCSFERLLMERFRAIKDQPTLARYLDGARKAGLRDCATPEEVQKYPKMMRLALCDAKRATN
jgi:adenylate cyclase